MKRLFLLLILPLTLQGMADSQVSSTGVCDRITVKKPIVVINSDKAKRGRLLFSIINPDDAGHRLKAAFAPAADRALLPDSLQDDPIWEPKGVAIPGNESRNLDDKRPIKLVGLHDIKPDRVTPVVVICEDGSHKLIKATVQIQKCEERDDANKACRQTGETDDD